MGTSGGALLVKNGKQTSCELAVIDVHSAFVSANCLDFSDGKVDTATSYEVYLNYGDGGQAAKYKIDSNISVHPSFDPDTLANNIAVVQYNDDDQSTTINTIPTNSSDWSSISYVRKSLSSGSDMAWNAPTIGSPIQEGSSCQDSSNIYSANTNAFLCTSTTTHNSDNCAVPYGSAVANVGGESDLIALYSHTAVVGDSLCGSTQQYSYYTLLGNYVGFAVSVLGRPVWTISNYQPIKVSDGSVFSMQPAKSGKVKGITVFGGDIYAHGATSSSTSTAASGTAGDSATSSGAGPEAGSATETAGTPGGSPGGSTAGLPAGSTAGAPSATGSNSQSARPTGTAATPGPYASSNRPSGVSAGSRTGTLAPTPTGASANTQSNPTLPNSGSRAISGQVSTAALAVNAILLGALGLML
ncbi:hypothetical protein GQ54DRAFT_292335 [Martensiomyces pterosporus]|nr:hypothetical protein GQ54DRAFT_292335 [Martensiomyces pterosporus]